MNGAQSLIRTLLNCGVDTCFMNPGTSEMHFVAALDSVPEMKGILALFEGVATGAADGYARIAGKPAATLLHLGPGLGNGLANLHNARRGNSPIVNIVGDQATHHHQYDAPLQSDIESVARNVSGWYRASTSPNEVAGDAADAVAASLSPPGQVATLTLPADVCWLDATEPETPRTPGVPVAVDSQAIESCAKALASEERTIVLIGGRLTREPYLSLAAAIAHRSGATLVGETFPSRLERGAGRPNLDRLGYLAEFMEMQLAGAKHLIVADTKEPVSFFAYPGKPCYLVPEGCEVHLLSDTLQDAPGALRALAEMLGTSESDAPRQVASRPDRPTGALNGESIAQALGALMPEHAIVADEGNTSGLWASGATAGCPPHDWLTLTGGSIGYGMPAATGAAVAARDRKVINLQAEGSAMYTLQSLWTQAREGLDVTTIILNNRSYAILNLELNRVGAEPPGPRAKEMLDLTGPDLDFVSLAQGMGVPATRASSAEEFTAQLDAALQSDGPSLVEAVIPSGM